MRLSERELETLPVNRILLLDRRRRLVRMEAYERAYLLYVAAVGPWIEKGKPLPRPEELFPSLQE